MAKTALVTGASGLLGRQVLSAFQREGWEAIGTGLTRASPPSIRKVDLCSKDEIEQILHDVKPQVVVHCAAQRFPDLVEADPSAARSLNVDATSSLARATSSRGIILLYISTDYVFPGTEGEAPYQASHPTNPPNLYGVLKRDGETEVLSTTEKDGLGVVLRVPVLYGDAKENKESAVNVLVDAVWKAQKEKVVMDDWSIRYPTNTEDVGRVCADIATTYLDAGDERKSLPKVLQFSSEDRFTKYEICELLAETLGLPMGKMEANKQGNDPSAKTQRPYDCHLSTKALKEVGVDVTTQDFKAWWRWQMGAMRR